MYDYNLVEQAKIEAEGKFKNTDSVFVLEAFYPEMEEEKLKQILDIVCDEIVYDLREPDDDEEVPTLVVNNKLIKPFESVTDMYSPPSYRGDFDPNPLMSFFYFLFFGMMIADAGYGLLFAIGGFILLKVTKPVPGKGKLILIVTLGGISTFIWGFLFGGWFGIDLELLGIDSPFLEKLRQAVGLRSFTHQQETDVSAAEPTKKTCSTLFKQYRENDAFRFKIVDGVRELFISDEFASGRDAGQWVKRLKGEPQAILEAPGALLSGVGFADVVDALRRLQAYEAEKAAQRKS